MYRISAFLLFVIIAVRSQENIQLQVPQSLVECYNSSFYMNRDNRLPSTVDTLISLIEKIENSYDGYNQDIRQLSVSMLHRFRQDGIQRATGVPETPNVLPFSPTDFQFPKFRLLLSRLIPGNALNFPNSSLTQDERCSLHFMLSSSFDKYTRGDESRVCSRLSEYRSNRLPRTNFRSDDVELLSARSTGSIRKSNLNTGWAETDLLYGSGENTISLCPVENGAVWTRWGSINAGTVIAGIAAGLIPQQVQLSTLLALSKRTGGGGGGRFVPHQSATLMVDNRWAATLAGDLAEVALLQLPLSKKETASIGAGGAWNNTVTPKWYFLTQRQNLEMTDAEIRGGLDGLIMGMNIGKWREVAPTLKLSQLLRMYYSLDGVLNSGIRACDRRAQFTNVAPLNEMIVQTNVFAQVLYREVQLPVTLGPEAIAQYAALAANDLYTYVPQSLNDVSCQTSSIIPQDATNAIIAMTDLYIFLDTSWQFDDIVDFLNYILQRLNVNAHSSRVTLLSASDCSVIVNRTDYITDIYRTWNSTWHKQFIPGFNLPMILRTSLNLTRELMDEEKANSSVGGRSLVALLMPNTAIVTDGESNYAQGQLSLIYEQVPDLKFIYFGGGVMSRFKPFVKDVNDLLSLQIGSSIPAQSDAVVARIKRVPRRIINPRCGSRWYNPNSGTDSMNQYVSAGSINYYRLVQNYYFGESDDRSVRIQTLSSDSLTICSSRIIKLPSANRTDDQQGEQNCIQLSGKSFTYDLSNVCGKMANHDCLLLYLSVAAPPASSTGQSGGGNFLSASCADAACQRPDQIRYSVSVVNLGCYSGVTRHIAGSFTIAFLAFIVKIVAF